MKRHTLTAAIGLALTLVIAVPVFAIVNGELDTDNDHPNVCAIVIDKTPANRPNLETPQTVSSATLVHPRVVMTAGHTVDFIRKVVKNNANIELGDFFVDFTPNAHDDDATKYRIAETRLHTGYTGRDATSIDVGLLILTEAVACVTPVELPEAGYLDDLDLDRGPSDSKPEFTVIGHGNTEAAPADGSLPDGERRVAFSTFKSLRTDYLMLSMNFALGEGAASRGDSGAPAFWDDDGTLVQVAILVNGDHASASYGSLVRTDLQTVIDFIDDAIDDVESE